MTSSHAQANVAPGAEDAAAAGHAVPVPASPSSADVIQREMEHLREMVFALSREVAIERAARDHLQKTVDAWEDPGDGADAGFGGQDGGDVRTETLGTSRARQAQQFPARPCARSIVSA